MIYKNLIRDHSFLEKMNQIIKKNRLPNSIILYGRDGIGKEAHAIELCAMILCKSNSKNPCGNCYNCIKVKNLQNENINMIYPLPRGNIKNKNDSIGKAISDKIKPVLAEDIKNKILNPYYKINIPGSKKILINSIRELKKTIFLSNINDNYKIVLIFDASKMCYPTQESGNSLLKILEEPPEKTIFILVTSEYNLLLETIKSRSQSFRLKLPDNQSINEYLSQLNKSKYTDIITKICNGNIRLAIEWNNETESFFEDLINIIRKYIFLEKIKHMPLAINQLEIWNKNGQIKIILDLLKNILCDIIKYKSYYSSKDKNLYTDLIINLSEKNKDASWNKCIQLVDATISNLKTNANFNIQLINFLMDFNRLLKGIDLEIFSIERWIHSN